MLAAALREAEFGNVMQAREQTAAALALAPTRDVQTLAALAMARVGNSFLAQAMANKLAKRSPLDTVPKRVLAAHDSGGHRNQPQPTWACSYDSPSCVCLRTRRAPTRDSSGRDSLSRLCTWSKLLASPSGRCRNSGVSKNPRPPWHCRQLSAWRSCPSRNRQSHCLLSRHC